MLLMEVPPCGDAVVLGSIPRSFCIPSYVMRIKIISLKMNWIVRNVMGVSLSSELLVSRWCQKFPKL